MCHRSRPDIMPTISILSGRVRDPNTDDWEKVRRLVQYLNCTRELHLILPSAVAFDFAKDLAMWHLSPRGNIPHAILSNLLKGEGDVTLKHINVRYVFDRPFDYLALPPPPPALAGRASWRTVPPPPQTVTMPARMPGDQRSTVGRTCGQGGVSSCQRHHE